MKKISVIIPLYNEVENIPEVYRRVKDVCAGLAATCTYEILFVDDGSTDGSLAAIEELAANDPNVKYLAFSRNFGKELATTAGLHNVTGDAAIMIDADLQHPPELFPKFIEAWERGAAVVIGVRKNGASRSFFKRNGARAYYWISSRISDTEFIPRATDFRLIDRRVIDEFKKFSEHTRVTRGLIDWLGFSRATIEFDAPDRVAGTPAYDTLKLTKLAISSFLSHSLFPLRVSGYLGAVIIVFSLPFGIFVGFTKFILNNPFSFTGTAALAIITLFLIGIVLACLGLIALYIENISVEVTERPLYIIQKKKI